MAGFGRGTRIDTTATSCARAKCSSGFFAALASCAVRLEALRMPCSIPTSLHSLSLQPFALCPAMPPCPRRFTSCGDVGPAAPERLHMCRSARTNPNITSWVFRSLLPARVPPISPPAGHQALAPRYELPLLAIIQVQASGRTPPSLGVTRTQKHCRSTKLVRRL